MKIEDVKIGMVLICIKSLGMTKKGEIGVVVSKANVVSKADIGFKIEFDKTEYIRVGNDFNYYSPAPSLIAELI